MFIATVYWINNVAITRKRTAGQRARALSAEGRKLKKRGKTQ
jgi:ribosomal protein L34